MINPAAVLGLENSESYKQLGQIKSGIEVLVKHKARDYDEERKHFKHEQEMDKRERQDLKFIQEKEAAEVVKYQKFMKSTDGGITAALLGGAAILGVLTAIGSIDIGKLVGNIWNGIKEFFVQLYTSRASRGRGVSNTSRDWGNHRCRRTVHSC